MAKSRTRSKEQADQQEKEGYYEEVRAIAQELVQALDSQGNLSVCDAWDFPYTELEEYVGGSGCPNTPPFGNPDSLVLSDNVAAGLEDGAGGWEGDTSDEDNEQAKIYFVVRYDVFQEVRKLKPTLAQSVAGTENARPDPDEPLRRRLIPRMRRLHL